MALPVGLTSSLSRVAAAELLGGAHELSVVCAGRCDSYTYFAFRFALALARRDAAGSHHCRMLAMA